MRRLAFVFSKELQRGSSCRECRVFLGSRICDVRGFASEGEGGEDGVTEEGGVETKKLEESTARKRPKRLTRALKGAYRYTDGVAQEIHQESPVWPENVPIYDPQYQVPWLYETPSPLLETYRELRRENPAEFKEILDRVAEEEEKPWHGANKILEWEINVVFDSSYKTGEPHPLNKKVKCKVYLRDLQHEFDLSDAAIQYIAMISGPRYNPKKGLLTLTSEKFRHREDNRIHVCQILTNLIAEGRKVYPKDAEQIARK